MGEQVGDGARQRGEKAAHRQRVDVARLQRELDKASKNKSIGGEVRLRAGFSAVSDLATANVNVAELVHRAESALDHAPIQGESDAIVSFDDLPVF